MGAWGALLDPADVQGGRPEVDLVPPQVDQLGDPQAVPIRHKDHRRVPVAPAIVLGCLDQSLDLCLGQVFASAQVSVGGPFWPDCSLFGGWRDQPEMRFSHRFQPPCPSDCSYNSLFTNSVKSNEPSTKVLPLSATMHDWGADECPTGRPSKQNAIESHWRA